MADFPCWASMVDGERQRDEEDYDAYCKAHDQECDWVLSQPVEKLQEMLDPNEEEQFNQILDNVIERRIDAQAQEARHSY